MKNALLRYVKDKLETETRLIGKSYISGSDLSNPRGDTYVSIGVRGFPVNLSYGHPKMKDQELIHIGITITRAIYIKNSSKFDSDAKIFITNITGNEPQRGAEHSGELRPIWRSKIDIPVRQENFDMFYELLIDTYLKFYGELYKSELVNKV
ncbi:hypothetical protein CCZ37_16620 [Vibrio qinghaiensis]|uniref:Uncharacterized protein n=1 Tax=Vibrio qinghaiensis TaxID=2025808 RepID=A0A223N3A4_9VIBR|nr:hypothetical protein [Vibrio qinghaiensis]ASU24133.1 hypothetical protein CCZ37_16620 [Vibrio qinghaiensis]